MEAYIKLDIHQPTLSATEPQKAMCSKSFVNDNLLFPHPPPTQGAPRPTSSTPTTKKICVGNHLTFPPGRNHHTLYPFGLHITLALPWDYHSVADRFFLQSTSCKKQIVVSHHEGSGDNNHACHSCETFGPTSISKALWTETALGSTWTICCGKNITD